MGGNAPLGWLDLAPRARARCRVPGGMWVVSIGVSLVLEGVFQAGVDAGGHGSLPASVLMRRVGGVRGV